MVNIIATILMFVLGAAMGSFACCQVWRIRKGDKSKWSHCMNCKYRLRWYDNIPIISWLLLGGKCRKCRKKIGYAEILSEFGLGAFFALSFVFWPEYELLMAGNAFEVIKFVLFLALLVAYTILFVFDAKWKEMPTLVMLVAIGISIAFAITGAVQLGVAGELGWDFVWLMLGSLMVLPMIYYLLYKLSGEGLVGGGDWILCVSIAIMIGNFWLGAFVLFVANALGCIIELPIALVKKEKKMKIPFGPFLIAGFWLIFMLQGPILALVSL